MVSELDGGRMTVESAEGSMQEAVGLERDPEPGQGEAPASMAVPGDDGPDIDFGDSFHPAVGCTGYTF